MTPQKQFKLMQARAAFERQAEFVRAELRTATRADHLQPVLDFLEWLVRDMAALAGLTLEVKAFAQAHAALAGMVAARAQELALQRMVRAKPVARAAAKPARPVLRLVKGGRR